MTPGRGPGAQGRARKSVTFPEGITVAQMLDAHSPEADRRRQAGTAPTVTRRTQGISAVTKENVPDGSSTGSGAEKGAGAHPAALESDSEDENEKADLFPSLTEFPENDSLGLELWNQAQQISILAPSNLNLGNSSSSVRVFSTAKLMNEGRTVSVQMLDTLASWELLCFFFLFLSIGNLGASTWWARKMVIVAILLFALVHQLCRRRRNQSKNGKKGSAHCNNEETPMYKCELKLGREIQEKGYTPRVLMDLLGRQLFFSRWRQEFEWVAANCMRIKLRGEAPFSSDTHVNFHFEKSQFQTCTKNGQALYGIVFQARQDGVQNCGSASPQDLQGREAFMYSGRGPID